MAQVDAWMEGRVLIAGDSRVRRLQGVPDPKYSKNVDFCFEGGVQIDNLINLVDDNLTEEHKVIILVGFLGDEVMKYNHSVDDDEEVTLIRSRECDSSANIITSVSSAHSRWMAENPARIILWTLPYYVDYSTFNAAKMGEFDAEDTVSVSWDSALRFVQYITRLRLQWVTSIPAVPFYPLNQTLFNGQNYHKMFQSFGAASGEHFKFPNNLLSDGLHPNSKLAKLMWFGIHQAVNRVNTLHSSVLPPNDIDDTVKPSNKRRREVTAPKSESSSIKEGKTSKRRNLHRTPLFQASKKSASSVHSRLGYQGDNSEEEELVAPVDDFYRNLSWRSSSSNLSRASTSRSAPLGTVQKSAPVTPWSWEYHHRVVRETRSKCYTQGIREQAIAEARLSSMIREHGLRAAGQGLVDSFNQARLKWSSNAMEKINAPDKRIRLVQHDLSNLLTDEEVDNDEEEEEEEEDTD